MKYYVEPPVKTHTNKLRYEMHRWQEGHTIDISYVVLFRRDAVIRTLSLIDEETWIG